MRPQQVGKSYIAFYVLCHLGTAGAMPVSGG